MKVTMVGAYQRGEPSDLTLTGVRETRLAAAREDRMRSRSAATLAGFPERSGFLRRLILLVKGLPLLFDATPAQQNRYLCVCGYEALGNMPKTPESSTLEPRMG